MVQAVEERKNNLHCARHTFATLQLIVGTDLYTYAIGHTDIKTTQIYGQIIDERKREAVNRIPDINI